MILKGNATQFKNACYFYGFCEHNQLSPKAGNQGLKTNL